VSLNIYILKFSTLAFFLKSSSFNTYSLFKLLLKTADVILSIGLDFTFFMLNFLSISNVCFLVGLDDFPNYDFESIIWSIVDSLN
jgi:hypothetical protein